MKRRPVIGLITSVEIAASAAFHRRRLLDEARANIRRYSMPSVGTYDLAARLLFRGRYDRIAREVAAETPAGSRVLDLACGPGEVVTRLARIAPSLETTGLDVDPAMIARAERKARRALATGAARRPDFVVADAAAIPFPDATFDLVISSYAVHHLPDREAAMAEAMRVLRPGGRLVIWDIASPHAGDPAAPSVPAHSHGAHGAHEAHGSHPAADSPRASAPPPQPSLLRTLRMLAFFRRIPTARYELSKS